MGILKKLKKGLKKVAKPAALLGAAYLASKGLRNKGKDSTTASAIKAMTSNDAYNDDTMPGNLSRDMGQKRKQFMPGIVDYMSKNGGRMGLKSGGKSKPKSIGKALRGGGKVMR